VAAMPPITSGRFRESGLNTQAGRLTNFAPSLNLYVCLNPKLNKADVYLKLV
jgi:hypothetical protein